MFYVFFYKIVHLHSKKLKLGGKEQKSILADDDVESRHSAV